MLAPLFAALFFPLTPVTAQQQQLSQFGEVHFPISCSAAAQRQFDRAMALQHSFVFPANVQAFAEARTQTPPAA
jgi:hypothetical protein